MEWLSEKRNHLFLGMCEMVHILLAVTFGLLGVELMMLINMISVLYYTWKIFIRKDFSEHSIVLSYFEIIIYATLATVLLGRQAGFDLYIIGMISVVFYLTYHYKNKRFLYQGVGVAIVILLNVFEPYINMIFIDYKNAIASYGRSFYMMNLVITLSTVVIVSYLYAQEINRMTNEINSMNKELDYQAAHDELTGLLNRREMKNYMERLSEVEGEHILVAMMDIDDFKQINDTYGHGTGDMVLKEVSALAARYLRDFKVARWGGEEFLLMKQTNDRSEGMCCIEQFHKAIREQQVYDKETRINISVTIGAVYGESIGNAEHLIQMADDLLYLGKQNGKNCIRS